MLFNWRSWQDMSPHRSWKRAAPSEAQHESSCHDNRGSIKVKKCECPFCHGSPNHVLRRHVLPSQLTPQRSTGIATGVSSQISQVENHTKSKCKGGHYLNHVGKWAPLVMTMFQLIGRGLKLDPSQHVNNAGQHRKFCSGGCELNTGIWQTFQVQNPKIIQICSTKCSHLCITLENPGSSTVQSVESLHTHIISPTVSHGSSVTSTVTNSAWTPSTTMSVSHLIHRWCQWLYHHSCWWDSPLVLWYLWLNSPINNLLALWWLWICRLINNLLALWCLWLTVILAIHLFCGADGSTVTSKSARSAFGSAASFNTSSTTAVSHWTGCPLPLGSLYLENEEVWTSQLTTATIKGTPRNLVSSYLLHTIILLPRTMANCQLLVLYSATRSSTLCCQMASYLGNQLL